MALLYRKKLREAAITRLAAADTGFNAAFAALAGEYGVTPFELDFSDGSTNFIVGHVNPEAVEKSRIETYPAACIYTTEAVDNNDPIGLSFAGAVMLNIDFYVEDRDGMETTAAELLCEAIEDAVLSVLNATSPVWPAGVRMQRKSQMDRQHLVMLADGFATRIPIRSVFSVEAA